MSNINKLIVWFSCVQCNTWYGYTFDEVQYNVCPLHHKLRDVVNPKVANRLTAIWQLLYCIDETTPYIVTREQYDYMAGIAQKLWDMGKLARRTNEPNALVDHSGESVEVKHDLRNQ